MQILGITAAIVFGIWAVKSYNVSIAGQDLQAIANQLTIRSLCLSDSVRGSFPPAIARLCLAEIAKPSFVTHLWL